MVEQWKVARGARVRASTAESQDMHLRVHILPALGNRKVRDISRATVLTWQAGLKRRDGQDGALSPSTVTLSPSTVNLMRATLSSVLDFAVASGVIAVNPCKTLTKGEKPKGEKKEKTILAPGDLDRLCAAVGRRKWMADVIEVALGQALRLGEVAGLDWQDVDFEANRLTVARSSALIICCRCKGSLEVEGEPCPRCTLDGAPTGVDPSSRCGCIAHDDEPASGGAVIVIDPEGGGFRPAGA